MTYILLRNNKERGPLSLADLRQAGLKPDDLVWVEGQSVCWLSPGEISELKSLVVAAGKQSTENYQAGNSGISSNSYMPQEESIHVSLPENGLANVQKKTELTSYEPVPENDSFDQQQSPGSNGNQTVITETKYSRPLDEIKEMYVKSLELRTNKKGFSLQIPPQLRKAGLYAALIAAGILAGSLLKNSGDKKSDVFSRAKDIQPATARQTAPAVLPPQDSTVINNNAVVMSEDPVTEARETLQEKITDKARQQQTDKIKQEAGPAPAKNAALAKTEEKDKRAADKEKETKIVSTDELISYVSVKSNDYDVGSFGGIKNLQLTVTNTSKYTLDHVTVELRYLKPRDEFLKAETISFRSVPPDGSQTVAVNKSNRGVKVSFKVIGVQSKEISGNTAGL
ncbi:MAG: DUF4339 domain-containing protein [Bacteroidota bacterium]